MTLYMEEIFYATQSLNHEFLPISGIEFDTSCSLHIFKSWQILDSQPLKNFFPLFWYFFDYTRHDYV